VLHFIYKLLVTTGSSEEISLQVMEDKVFRNGLICGQGTLGHCEGTWDGVVVAKDPRTVGIGESVLDLTSTISSCDQGFWQGTEMNSIGGSHHTYDRWTSSRCLSNSDMVTVASLRDVLLADSFVGDILACLC
jgi:hypothetical protein